MLDYEEFQEKMNPEHRRYLCRMLRTKVLPERLLDLYLKVKTICDRIDAPLNVGTLAVLVVMSGAELPEKEVEENKAAEPPVEPAAKFWSTGMPVNVLDDSQIKPGKIVGIILPEQGSEKNVQLTVEYDGGETVTVDETEVEAT